MAKARATGSGGSSENPSNPSAELDIPQSTAQAIYKLREQGKPAWEIAEIVGITHLDDIYRALAEHYHYESKAISSQERQSLLALEVARLDALQDAIWDSAMMGDPKSVDTAVKIVQTRVRITGLEQVDPVINKNLVLVMGEKEDDYIQALKAAGSSDAGG